MDDGESFQEAGPVPAIRLYPPKPPARATRPGPLTRLRLSLDNSLGPLYARSYSMKMGEVRTPRRRMHFIVEPRLAQRVLAESVTRYPKSVLMKTMLELLIGDGILVSRGQAWARQRRMIEPAFEQLRIKAIFPLMRDAADAMAARLADGAAGPNTRADLEATHATADVIFRALFSRPFDRGDAAIVLDELGAFQELVWKHTVWRMAGVPPSWSISRRRAARHAEAIRAIFAAPVRERLGRIARGEDVAERDLLQSLIEAVDPETGTRFDERELIDQIGTLFLAGYGTTASSLGWALYLIAACPETQARLHAEADSAFADGPLAFERMRMLGFTRDVFRETLRLYPPVAFVTRDATESEVMRGKRVNAGEMLFVSPWISQRCVTLWDDPDAFDPDRYARPETRKCERDGWLAFSRGPRACAGASFAMQEAVLIIATIMRDWRLAPTAGHVPEPCARLVLRSRNGIRLDFERR